ncbi:mastermind-like protein 2 [Hippocampus comes]|nr:PREDICTED: mastermind-like protein 2 [Hippocampus comes]
MVVDCAIVERLRARIELCRRHHSTCEDRYRRGQAESSDREHESTLQLLNVVQQGPGTRKSKGGRGAAGQPPPDYGARPSNGELRGAEGDHKMSTRIALQGSLRRKLEGHAPKHNSVSCSFSGSDFKRVRLETGGGLGRGPCNHGLSHAHSSQAHSSAGGKNYVMPDVFDATLKEMKKEPGEAQSSCSRSRADAVFDFKDEGGAQIDPELQDLFDELTKSVPPLNDLDLEKMLKQDDAFGLDLGRPGSTGLGSPLERPIKMERSPDYAQVHVSSPQLRPASAGPSLALTAPTAAQKAGAQQSGPPRSMPCWPEISHAEQLKQMAANQHQPGTLLHHQHHQAPPAGLAGWGPAMGPAFQDKGARPRLPQHSKGVANCLFKSNGVHHVEMKPLAAKPTLHFSPKSVPPLPPSSGRMMPMMAGNKTANHPQQLSPPDAQNHTNPPPPPLHFQNQQMSSSTALLQEGTLPFKLSQHQQGVPPGPRLTTNGGVGQPRPPLPPHPLRAPAKSPAMHRQLSQLHRAEKDTSPDQFSRHLTRPPPDYKRSVVGGNIFPGANPSQSSSAVPEKDLHSMSCHLPGGPASELSSSEHRFDCHPPSCIGQFPSPNRLAPNHNKVRFLGPNAQGNTFGMSNGTGGPHPRPAADPHSSRVAGQVPGAVMTNVSWCSAAKPVGLARRNDTLDLPLNHQYQQRPGGPPNQVAPDLQMLIRDAGSRPTQANINQSSPEQQVPAVGNFAETASGGYQSARTNRVTFDFLPEGDNTVPGINTDSDFIDSLLKSGSGNDDWMKDINLDEILGSHA